MPTAHCIVLFDDQTASLGGWVLGIVKNKMSNVFQSIHEEKTTETEFITRAKAVDATLQQEDAADDTTAGTESEKQIPSAVTVVIAAYWDGLSDEAKSSFSEFKKWAAERKVSLVVQALNAKRGSHTLMDNEAALVSSIQKKLPPGCVGSGTPAAGGGGATQDVMSKEEKAEVPTEERVSLRLRQGQGECCWVISSPAETFDSAVAQLHSVATVLNAGVFPITPEPREVPSSTQPNTTLLAREFMLRSRRDLEHIEMRIAMCGNVDSGKSTLTSVLTRGVRDDGRGLARAFVFNHKHEQDTGRTSSVSENHLGFDVEGHIVNYDGKSVNNIVLAPVPIPKDASVAAAAAATDGGSSADATETTKVHYQHMSTQELAMKSAKVVTLYDLAGHEKYLKTTVLGMTRSMPDYACIVVSANNGIQRMTKEHLGLCLALKLPFFIVVTRIDATPENVRHETTQTILKLLKMPTVKKLPFPIKKPDDVIVASKNLMHDRITPIFEVSNVTGQGIREVLQFINLMPVRKDWSSLVREPKEMVVDSTFFVTGVGTVAGGIILQGQFKTGDFVWLGPDGLGAFRQTQIKSIHVKGVEVDHVDAGNDAALCLKKEKRSSVRKGNVLLEVVDPKVPPKAFWQFEAEIVILYHSTTISTNYEPVIHCTTVRQSARIILVEQQEVLRTGDRSIVRFHFLYRPEFMKIGQRMIFREGRTKGIGTITRLIEEVDEGFLGTTKRRIKETARSQHQK